MSGSDRVRRVSELLQREISEYVERRISSELNCLMTINRVKAAPDFHDAIVYVSLFGGEEKDKKKALRLLLKHRADIQAQINRNMKLRATPRLDIRVDDSLEKGGQILDLFDELGL